VQQVLGIRSYNFDGTEGSMEIYGKSKTTQIWNVNYEVKTLSASSDAETLYKNLSEGINQTISRGDGKNNIGVLMTDKKAWTKVANDPKFGPLLKADYDRLVKSGNHLRLEDDLNSDAEKALNSLKDKIIEADK
jgi:hypothetical protein